MLTLWQETGQVVDEIKQEEEKKVKQKKGIQLNKSKFPLKQNV